MAGTGAYSKCDGTPTSWAINMQNPYDFTNFAYVNSVDHTYVEDVSIEGDGLNPPLPYGDIYLGIVGKKCDDDVKHPVKSKCDGIEYVKIVKDAGYGGTPMYCMTGYSPNGYGGCEFAPKEKHHYYESRDWESVMDKYGGPIFCCSMPPTYTFDTNDPWMSDLQNQPGCLVDGENPRRTMKCPPTYYPGSPLCVPILLENCSDSNNWKKTDFVDGDGNKFSYCDLYMQPNNGVALNNQQNILVAGLQDWVVNTLNYGQKKPDPSNDSRVGIFTQYCALSENVGLCDTYLKQACTNVTMDDLKGNPDLAKMCGCFMQDNEYAPLQGIIPVECNAICAINASGALQGGVPRGYFNEESGMMEPLVCNESTCVMSDIVVDVLGSEAGNIDFTQICGNCPGGVCQCVFDNITISEINSSMGNVDFTQNCGGCSQSGINATGQPVSCTGEPLVGGSKVSVSKGVSGVSKSTSSVSSTLWLVIGVVVLILLIVFVVLL